MVQANIIDNKVYCSKGHHNYRVKDYKAVNYKGKALIEFKAYCIECSQEFNYLASIGMKDTKYYNFDEDEIKEIKESKKEGCINE
jgi:hypothetical protein